ncbi:MAG TPA: glutamate-5-semialdehyde dehydrogenase [Candidatus Limnocylindrales bacterium]|nr:glutamate-5-semialdehyde dehydrogenase [Candidatus Limnocylindrales bacterium]
MTDSATLDLTALGVRAKTAARQFARASTAQKNRALLAIAQALEDQSDAILAANAADLEAARARRLSEQLITDRFDLKKRMTGMIADVRRVAELPDPVGREYDQATLPNGLRIHRRRTPLGVVGVIYEARPNVTVDCAALTLKTGNAAVLRGGSEVFRSNAALIAAIRGALAALNDPDLPADAVQFVNNTDRQYVEDMLKLHQHIDVIIPRGGASLHQFCREHSTIPVIIGGMGVCHLYVDQTADLDAALPVIFNAKTQRPSVCNSLDTLLVHEVIAAEFLPRVVAALQPANVSFRAEPQALAALGTHTDVQPAGPEDFDTEWMALILGLKVVRGLDDALDHIYAHSTFHSDGILTEDCDQAARFINEVDSAAVFINASTRFNDGGALGLGAEIAVSTQKLHVRGPMALEELTTYKWVVEGDYHVRT